MKVCSRCGEVKPSIAFYVDRRNNDSLDYWCKSCRSVARKVRYWANREQAISAARQWNQDNIERVRISARANRANNVGVFRARRSTVVRELHDSYIRELLKHEHITPELIEIKRTQIKLKRLIRQLKRGDNHESSNTDVERDEQNNEGSR